MLLRLTSPLPVESLKEILTDLVLIEPAKIEDRKEVERLIAAYHESEGITPRPDRISWAVEQCLYTKFPGILLVARQGSATVGVALAVYSPSAELGRVLDINDFYVEPQARRKGIGHQLAEKLLAEARKTKTDRVELEVLPTNKIAALFWRSLGFETHGRTLYSRDI